MTARHHIGRGIVVGLVLGWLFYRPAPTPPEAPAKAERQADGSYIPERRPVAEPAKVHDIPKGGKVERQVQVTVKPRPVPATKPPEAGIKDTLTPAAPAVDCPPVTLDLSLVRMPDGGARVVTSSPDGEVTGGFDSPIAGAVKQARDLRWTVSAARACDWLDQKCAWGAAATYSRGPFTVGGLVVPGINTGAVTLGIRLP